MAQETVFLTREMNDFCRRRAIELIHELGLTDPPVNVEEVARACGLEVCLVKRGRGFDGQLIRERRLIEIQQDIHPHRRRFTIAHEIGHHVLGHTTVFCSFDETTTGDPRRFNERQANVFASELLMPDPWIRRYWTLLRKDYRALAQKFYVSDEAMFRRLTEANLLGLEPLL
jgi:Zn-dependent peptidase ImmA (M78 family)